MIDGSAQHISLSEIAASALRRAHAVHPVTAVEVELSLFALEEEVKEVLEACDELGITLVAYSPLGRGFLAGRYKSPEDLGEGDMRRMQPRFQGENFYLNLKVVDAVVSPSSEIWAEGMGG
jgi:pyridoxine 4-dehydrogenase